MMIVMKTVCERDGPSRGQDMLRKHFSETTGMETYRALGERIVRNMMTHCIRPVARNAQRRSLKIRRSDQMAKDLTWALPGSEGFADGTCVAM